MSGLLENVQPAVKKETKRVVMITGAGLILMWTLFAILHFTMPDKVPFDYTVIVAPCFQFVAGIAPLLFPGTGLKFVGIFHKAN